MKILQSEKIQSDKYIGTSKLADRWDTSRQTAVRVAMYNRLRYIKLGIARNAGIKFYFPDILQYEQKNFNFQLSK